MRKRVFYSHIGFYTVLLLCLVLAAAILLPSAVSLHAEEKTVRVGWYDSSYNTIDSSGNRTGYAYEYQLKIASYTGWKYEYVNGSWSDLMHMLNNGDIDLMSDVSYTRERAKHILYSDLPMGTEEYFLFIAPGNQEIKLSDPSTLNEKRVGVNNDSLQADLYVKWAEENGVSSELVLLNTSEDESLRMMETGVLDAYVTVDSFTDPERAEPVYKIGSSDYYFAVSSRRPDLLEDLNMAMNKILDENRYYNQQMFEQYINTAGSNAFLTEEEEDWISAHGKIRVGYQDNYLAFCALDPNTGELTGALKEYLDIASDSLINARLTFDTEAFSTVEEALNALKEGEVDCVFPANLRGCDGEQLGIAMTPPLMRTDIYALVPQEKLSSFARKEYVIVAVNEGNPNYDAVLRDNFPDWHKVYYPDTDACMKAVKDGVADCILISSYRFNNLSRLCDKYNLEIFPTGKNMDYCFAIDRSEPELYAILSKVNGLIPESTINAALSFYITEDARMNLGDFIADNLFVFIAVIAAVVAVILLLLIRSRRMEKKAKQLISVTETDKLTGLYNRDYFFEYADRIYHEHPETHMDAIVLNIEQFHSINALSGRDFGDQVLKVLGNEIRLIAEESGGIGGRFGADRFDIYCRSGSDYQEIFYRLQKKLNSLSPNASIRLRMGAAAWQEGIEPVQLFDRARTVCSMARGHYNRHLIVFDESVREKELFDQGLLNDLRSALDNFEFEIYYQPKFDIQADPPKLVSAEALIRWHHPILGMIMPNEFIPLFERNGMIGEIDKYVWTQAARQIARWKIQYGITIPVSVNLSRVDVFDPMLGETLDEILYQNGLPHDILKLEVTESAYIEDSSLLIRVVDDLRKNGYIVEMDDFGTGYSSLNMLSSMPVDVIKMDRKFICNIEQDEKDVQMVALILGIAKSLKIPVIAEGVETAYQMQLLKELGCSMVQGYYFSRPLHHSEFEARFLQEQRKDS